MNWEAVTAIGTVFTGLVILFTVILGGRQLDHLRRATQLEGATAVFAELESARFVEAQRFVREELAAHLKDRQFRDEARLIGFGNEIQHKELIVLRFFERIGLYTNAGLLDKEIVYGMMSGRVVAAWYALRDVVAIHREEALMWPNFENLVQGTMDWLDRHGAGKATREHLAAAHLVDEKPMKRPQT
jgi:hypothetical protein